MNFDPIGSFRPDEILAKCGRVDEAEFFLAENFRIAAVIFAAAV